MAKKLTILVVDDDRLLRNALAHTLRARGHEVISAASGPEALEVLRDRSIPVEIVMSDYEMPGMNGLELLQVVRINRPSLLRVLLTGAATTELAMRALNEQAAHRMLLKPWHRVELESTLQIAYNTLPSQAKC